MADNDREIFDRLGKIEQIVARIDERTKGDSDKHADHERRIRSLEDKEARRGGVLAALTAVGSTIGAALTWLIHHFIGGAS
jgi:hypothetical protein